MRYLWSFLLIAVALGFFFFSYLWIDLSIVLLVGDSHKIVNNLYPYMEFGEGNRQGLANVYIFLISLFFLLQLAVFKFFHQDKKILFITAGITTFIFSVSYPFLSHDIFTYLFFSKVVQTYQLNPYHVTPEQFYSTDLWVGPVHSVQGNYRYGIVYLLYTLVPMFILTGSRFVLNFFALKLLNGVLFFLTGLVLYKFFDKSPKVFSLWFFNLLLIVELLINAHNDLLMICLFIFSMILLYKKKYLASATLMILSAATKYVSMYAAPALFMKDKWREAFLSLCCIVIVTYLYITSTAVHLWYFTWLYMFLPFIKLKNISWVLIYAASFLGLIDYSGFIKTKDWGQSLIMIDPRLLFVIIMVVIILIEISSSDMLKRRLSKYLTR